VQSKSNFFSIRSAQQLTNNLVSIIVKLKSNII
jgi:hypothetical protein